MKKYIFVLTLFLVSLLLSNAISGDTYQNTWRCGNNLIEIGDSKGDIIAQCGEPSSKESTGVTTFGAFSETKNNKHSRGGYAETAETSEEWFYNCGPYGFNAYLIFKGSRLYRIRIGSYGEGESFCDGADLNPNTKKANRDAQLNSEYEKELKEAERDLLKAQTEKIKNETYQNKRKALLDESEKAAAAHKAKVKDQEEKNKAD